MLKQYILIEVVEFPSSIILSLLCETAKTHLSILLLGFRVVLS